MFFIRIAVSVKRIPPASFDGLTTHDRCKPPWPPLAFAVLRYYAMCLSRVPYVSLDDGTAIRVEIAQRLFRRWPTRATHSVTNTKYYYSTRCSAAVV